jgi:hypothetical protein
MTHHHVFRVDPPGGPSSQGACACGESRVFFNSADAEKGSKHWRNVGTPGNTRKMSHQELRALTKSQKETALDLASAVSGAKRWR